MTNIFVGNLSYQATEQDLRQAFEAHGTVSSVSIIMDKMTGRSRGFGFVEMPDAAQAQAAIKALNLQEIQGRAMTVNEARPKGEGAPRGGGGGRGGYGGGGGGGGRRDRW
ncbi:MAG: RNA-binding protein [Planctomycetes bacterium]|nr:RNA-binding protein [Planctomycetota bacterium]